jgi:predicted Rossmann fold flavoprotein
LDTYDLAVVGGGAAGFMTAITAAENGVKRIIILEGTSKLMEKIRISGGGRCNVTNATWIPNELVENYPRGGIQLLESFNRFAAGDVFDWFEKKGLKLKIEEDLRVFPVSNSSSDVIDCLRKSATSKNVEILTKFFVKEILKTPDNLFNIFSLKQEKVISKNIILSTGGHPSGYKLAQNLGHSIVKPVPSLFTFSTKEPNLGECSGVSIKGIDIEIILNNKTFQNRGDLLITHWGFSGPAVLKLSSIAARELFIQKYKFNLIIKWSVLSYQELKEKIRYL